MPELDWRDFGTDDERLRAEQQRADRDASWIVRKALAAYLSDPERGDANDVETGVRENPGDAHAQGLH